MYSQADRDIGKSGRAEIRLKPEGSREMTRPQFTEAERQLLIACSRVVAHDGRPDCESLAKLGRAFFNDDFVDWGDAYTGLEAKGLLTENEGLYSLSKEGSRFAAELLKEDFNKGFSEHLVAEDLR